MILLAMMVRNEADIVALNLEHHPASKVDRLVIPDDPVDFQPGVALNKPARRFAVLAEARPGADGLAAGLASGTCAPTHSHVVRHKLDAAAAARRRLVDA